MVKLVSVVLQIKKALRWQQQTSKGSVTSVKQSATACVTPAKLHGNDTTGIDITVSDIAGSDISGSDITGSGITRSDITGSDITGSGITGSDINKSDFAGIDITGSGTFIVFHFNSVLFVPRICKYYS
jgi:uncharacterized protein YjbI with pentapeptide repeats